MEDNNKKFYENIKELMFEIGEFYKGDDWLFVKKYIVRYSRPSSRTLLSTRNENTKKHSLNDIEKKLIQDYYNKYKILLELKCKDKHKESE